MACCYCKYPRCGSPNWPTTVAVSTAQHTHTHPHKEDFWSGAPSPSSTLAVYLPEPESEGNLDSRLTNLKGLPRRTPVSAGVVGVPGTGIVFAKPTTVAEWHCSPWMIVLPLTAKRMHNTLKSRAIVRVTLGQIVGRLFPVLQHT